MEIRQIEAFVAVADELHFGRAAQRIGIGQPALSELVQRLERELRTPLFTRTTRRVALTLAGDELLPRARAILEEVAAAKNAVRRVATGKAGTLRIGITPPVAPTLAPHLTSQFADRARFVALTVQQLWLPAMTQMLVAGEIDVGITCGITLAQHGIVHESFCAEPLLVALRPEHPLAAAPAVELADLADDTLGMPRDSLFPAWTMSQRQALARTGIEPRIVELDDTDIAARRWQDQRDVDWIMLIGSFADGHDPGTLKSVASDLVVPFVLQWSPDGASSAAVGDFVEMALSVDLPPGWVPGPAHRGSVGAREAGSSSAEAVARATPRT